MEAKRLLDVLDKQLAQHKFVAGDEYTIADMAVWPWFGNVVLGNVYDAAEFLDAGSYKHVQRWAKEVAARPAVKRGRIVNRTNGPLNEQLHERHDASDFRHQYPKIRQQGLKCLMATPGRLIRPTKMPCRRPDKAFCAAIRHKITRW